MISLEGKVALVTGATKGIGLAIAKLFKKLKCSEVIILGRNEERLNELKNEGFLTYKCDVSNKDEVDTTIKAILDNVKKIDILVNNAGITKDSLFLRMKDEDFEEVVRVNLLGTFYVTRRVLPIMVKQKYGKIVNISSVVGLMGNIGQSNYASTKSALIGFAKSLAKEYGRKNILINNVAPGFIETDMTAKIPERLKEEILNKIPLKRYGKPEEVANLVAFLVSDLNTYITGQTILIDGGLY